VNTNPVTSPTVVTISATYGGSKQTATLQLTRMGAALAAAEPRQQRRTARKKP
jgi:hypothetical protein